MAGAEVASMVDLGKGAAAEELAELVFAEEGIVVGGRWFDLWRHGAAEGQRSRGK